MRKILLFLFICTFSVHDSFAQDCMEKARAQYHRATAILRLAEYEKAVDALRLAIDEGYGEAAYLLGNLYFYGLKCTDTPVKSDEEKAILMFNKALELGHDKGDIELGRMYLYGWGTEEKQDKAFEHFLAAYEKGIKEARYFLARCYWSGWGTEKSEENAFELIKDNYDEANKFYDTNVLIMMAYFLKDDRYRDEFYNKWYSKLTYAEHGEKVMTI